jgi:hypothetical protein
MISQFGGLAACINEFQSGVAGRRAARPAGRLPMPAPAATMLAAALWQCLLFVAPALADPADPSCETPAFAARYDFCNHSLPVESRVEDLLGHLTMQEKTASVLEAGGSVPRLGIPHLGTTECLRGYLSMVPQALAMSQSWNRTLVRAVAAATSSEVRAAANAAQGGAGGGSLACFDPVINICRDPVSPAPTSPAARW